MKESYVEETPGVGEPEVVNVMAAPSFLTVLDDVCQSECSGYSGHDISSFRI